MYIEIALIVFFLFIKTLFTTEPLEDTLCTLFLRKKSEDFFIYSNVEINVHGFAHSRIFFYYKLFKDMIIKTDVYHISK